MKKILFYVFIVLSVFIIYKYTYKKEIKYVAMGDELSLGINSYDYNDYGYNDYLVDYFKQKNYDVNYSNFSKRNYELEDLIEDINNNIKNDEGKNIKRELRESNIVILSIGLNDIYGNSSLGNILVKQKNIDKLIDKSNEITKNLDTAFKQIKKYAKGKLYFISLYTPSNFECENINQITEFYNNEFKRVCNNNKVVFVKYNIDDNKTYLNNPKTIYPNTHGYNQISDSIIKNIENNSNF